MECGWMCRDGQQHYLQTGASGGRKEFVTDMLIEGMLFQHFSVRDHEEDDLSLVSKSLFRGKLRAWFSELWKKRDLPVLRPITRAG